MTTFKDATGREWSLSLDLDTVERIHQETNVSIYLLLADECKPLAVLMENLPALAHVCYIACDAQDAGVDRKAFCKALKGDAFDAMANAFLEELTLFFPDPRRRAAVDKLITVARSLQEKGLKALEKEMARVNPEKIADTVLTQMLRKKSGSLSAGSATSASRRERSRSEN